MLTALARAIGDLISYGHLVPERMANDVGEEMASGLDDEAKIE